VIAQEEILVRGLERERGTREFCELAVYAKLGAAPPTTTEKTETPLICQKKKYRRGGAGACTCHWTKPGKTG